MINEPTIEQNIVATALQDWEPHSGREGLLAALDNATMRLVDNYDDLDGDTPIPVWFAPLQAENLNTEGMVGWAFLEELDEEGIKKGIEGFEPLSWLVKSQGYTPADVENTNSPFLDSLETEISVGYFNAALIFYGTATFDEVRKIGQGASIVAPTDIIVGLFDPTNGGGSTLGVELEKPVDIPLNMDGYIAEMVYSGERTTSYGYSVEGVYGMGMRDLPKFQIS